VSQAEDEREGSTARSSPASRRPTNVPRRCGRHRRLLEEDVRLAPFEDDRL